MKKSRMIMSLLITIMWVFMLIFDVISIFMGWEPSWTSLVGAHICLILVNIVQVINEI